MTHQAVSTQILISPQLIMCLSIIGTVGKVAHEIEDSVFLEMMTEATVR